MNNFYRPFFHYRYPCYTYCPSNIINKQLKKESTEKFDLKKETKQDPSSSECSEKRSTQVILEFHGIKLFSDDLLILLVIYFLYKQNINDTLLYLALFALLLA